MGIAVLRLIGVFAAVLLPTTAQAATRVRYAWADSPFVNLFDEGELTPGTFEVPIGN